MLKRIMYIAALGFVLALLVPSIAQAGASGQLTVVKATVEPGNPGQVNVTDNSSVDPDVVIELDCNSDSDAAFTPDAVFTPHGSTRTCLYPQAGKFYVTVRASYAGSTDTYLSNEFVITPGDELPQGISVVGSSTLELPGALVLASPKPNLDFACREAGCGTPTITRSGPVGGLYQYAVQMDLASVGTHAAIATAWRNDSRFAEAQDITFTVAKSRIGQFKLLEREWVFTPKGKKCLVEDRVSFYLTDSAMVEQAWQAKVGRQKKRKTVEDSYSGSYFQEEAQFGLAVSMRKPSKIRSTTSVGKYYEKTATLKLTPKKLKRVCGK